MSHGPSITVYDLSVKDLQNNKEKIINLMKGVEIGTIEERNYVSEYITNMLIDKISEKDIYMFAFWNHGEGQEVEDYETLCNLFEVYGKIISHFGNCVSINVADYRDYKLFCWDGESYKLKDKEKEDLDDYMNTLELKSDIVKGQEAKKKLSEMPKKRSD